MGCLSSKEVEISGGNKYKANGTTPSHRNSIERGGLEPRNKSHQEHSTSQEIQDRRSSHEFTNNLESKRSKERVITDPRGGHKVRNMANSQADKFAKCSQDGMPRHNQKENDEGGTGFTSRNQFDRASQLRRSKKSKKKKELNSSMNSPKTPSGIVENETKRSSAKLQDTNKLSGRTEHHSKYGNLI